MIARRPAFRFAPSDPRAVRARFQKIAARAAVRARAQLAALRPPRLADAPRRRDRAA
jgi:hypothetical protein